MAKTPGKGNISPFLKSLRSKIHPPLPLSSRDSEKLLSIVTSSFRRELDERHPPVKSKSPLTPPRVRKPRRATPTDHHLSSILGHPLFNTPPRPKTQSDNSENGSKPLKKPLTVLKDAMASGRADVRTLYECLKADMSVMRSLPLKERRHIMRDSHGGSAIVSWFAATDSESRERFLSDNHVIQLAMPYLVSEGLQETVVTWLENVCRQNPTPGGNADIIKTSGVFSFCLLQFLRAEIRYGNGINSALELILRIHNIGSTPGPHERPGEPFQTMVPGLQYSTRFLSRWISNNETELKSSPIPVELFNRFTSHCDRLKGAVSSRALLALHHPTHPDPELALQLTKLRRPQATKPEHRARLVRLCFKAVEVCMQHGREADAQWLLTYARQILPSVDSRPQKSNTQARETVPSDELVSRLNAAFG